MKLEDHVASLELSRAWKEAGGRQDTEFYWREAINEDKAYIFQVSIEPSAYASDCAAPLASEVMEWYKDRPDRVYDALLEWVNDRQTFPNALLQMALALKEGGK